MVLNFHVTYVTILAPGETLRGGAMLSKYALQKTESVHTLSKTLVFWKSQMILGYFV